MTKEELYSALESINDKCLNIANQIRNAEQTLTGSALTEKLDEIQFVIAQAELPGDEIAKDYIVKLCNIIDENG